MSCGDQPACTCGPYWSVNPPSACPVHCPWFYTAPVTRAAWTCPRCQRVNAPHAMHCDCTPTTVPATVTWPPGFVYPYDVTCGGYIGQGESITYSETINYQPSVVGWNKQERE